MSTITRILSTLQRWVRSVGPYLILEMLMPGGTLLALLLFLIRRRSVLLRAVGDGLPR